MRLAAFVYFIALVFPGNPSYASETLPWLEWQSNNIQILHGGNFEFGDERQTTLTFEHANGWRYGDTFFYIDYSLDEPDTVNAEISPRLSFSKITGQDLSYGVVQDILVSTTLEKGRNFTAYLYGGAIDLALPGFNLFQINLYQRNNPDVSGKGWQTTVVWNYPFTIGSAKMSFEGYFDYADYEEGVKNFFTQPQLLLDAGHSLGIAPDGKLYAGVEYRYWNNLYGIDGITEKVPQAVVKWVF